VNEHRSKLNVKFAYKQSTSNVYLGFHPKRPPQLQLKCYPERLLGYSSNATPSVSSVTVQITTSSTTSTTDQITTSGSAPSVLLSYSSNVTPSVSSVTDQITTSSSTSTTYQTSTLTTAQMTTSTTDQKDLPRLQIK